MNDNIIENGDTVVVKNSIYTPTNLHKYVKNETPIFIDGEINKVLDTGEVYIQGSGKFVPEEFRKVT